jgi:hypothetical protein
MFVLNDMNKLENPELIANVLNAKGPESYRKKSNKILRRRGVKTGFSFGRVDSGLKLPETRQILIWIGTCRYWNSVIPMEYMDLAFTPEQEYADLVEYGEYEK